MGIRAGWCIVLVMTGLSWLEARAEEPAWEEVAVGTGKLAVPRGWRSFDGIRPRMVIFRQGDGAGVPAADETGAPLQMGLTVEKFAESKETLQQTIDKLIEQAQKAPRLEVEGKPSVDDVTLSDGTASKVLLVEFIKEKTRRSLQMKLVARDDAGTSWIVTAYVVGGKASAWPKPGSACAKWLLAHVKSLSFDAKKFNTDAVKAAHAELAK